MGSPLGGLRSRAADPLRCERDARAPMDFPPIVNRYAPAPICQHCAFIVE